MFAELRPVEGETAPLQQLPAYVRDAFVSVEDRRFYEHGAIDWRRVAGAALANLRHGGVEQGFSTIGMQLARNVFPDRIRGERRTLGRKLTEIRVAYEIEGRFAKDEILELYLSHIYFGNGARGIEAAARHYFGTSATRLSLSQTALLAALIRGPAYYDPRRHPDRARARRDFILTVMESQKRITPEAARRARAAPLRVVPRRPWAGNAPGLGAYYVEEVRRQLEDRFGERVYDETMTIATTLDVGLQRAAEDELERQLSAADRGALGRLSQPPPRGPEEDERTSGSPDLQGAVVALDVATGDVLAWVGGRDFRQSRFDRVKSAYRQAGSAFKPFVYAAALARGHHLSEHLKDEPMSLRLKDGRVWQPKNFDREFEGEVTLREALVRSKNVPTVRLGQAVGGERIARVAHDAGIRSDIDETPAMPLGTVAVSPLELATAYTALAGLGDAVVPRLVLRVRGEEGEELWAADPPQRRRVIDPGVAYLVTDVLREAVHRGTGTAVRSAGFRGDAAGKTGTTNDATDTWFVGYTPRIVSAVWIGFDEPRPIMAVATGSRLAAPVWGRMMARARAAEAHWKRPATVSELWVDPKSGSPLRDGCRPEDGWALRELFLRESLPRLVCPDRGDPLPDEAFEQPSDEDAPRDYDVLPEDDENGGSLPPPPPDYEEAEWPKQRAVQWWRDHPDELAEARRGQRHGLDDAFEEETERAWRAVREAARRRFEEWLRSRQEQQREREREEQRDEP